jgi:hypothetical protein
MFVRNILWLGVAFGLASIVLAIISLWRRR